MLFRLAGGLLAVTLHRVLTPLPGQGVAEFLPISSSGTS